MVSPSQKSARREPSGAERRRWPRARVDLTITLALDGGTAEARLRDLSRSGLCFYLDRPIPLMTQLGLEVELPVQAGKRQVRARGAVVRSEKISAHLDHYEIAVFLHEIAEPDRRTLEEFVRAREGGREAGAERSS